MNNPLTRIEYGELSFTGHNSLKENYTFDRERKSPLISREKKYDRFHEDLINANPDVLGMFKNSLTNLEFIGNEAVSMGHSSLTPSLCNEDISSLDNSEDEDDDNEFFCDESSMLVDLLKRHKSKKSVAFTEYEKSLRDLNDRWECEMAQAIHQSQEMLYEQAQQTGLQDQLEKQLIEAQGLLGEEEGTTSEVVKECDELRKRLQLTTEKQEQLEAELTSKDDVIEELRAQIDENERTKIEKQKSSYMGMSAMESEVLKSMEQMFSYITSEVNQFDFTFAKDSSFSDAWITRAENLVKTCKDKLDAKLKVSNEKAQSEVEVSLRHHFELKIKKLEEAAATAARDLVKESNKRVEELKCKYEAEIAELDEESDLNSSLLNKIADICKVDDDSDSKVLSVSRRNRDKKNRRVRGGLESKMSRGYNLLCCRTSLN